MKIVAYLLILYGAFLLFHAARQQYSGHTTIAPQIAGGSLFTEYVSRSKDPVRFRDAMMLKWARASAYFVAGLILLSIIRGQDRLDPMSPSFAGKEEIDKPDDPPEK